MPESLRARNDAILSRAVLAVWAAVCVAYGYEYPHEAPGALGAFALGGLAWMLFLKATQGPASESRIEYLNHDGTDAETGESPHPWL